MIIVNDYIELMDNFEISTFILDLVGIVTVQGKGFDELIDAAIYPEWKDIQLKFSNDDLYHQLIQFVNFYHSEYEFDNRPQFEILGEKYKNNAPDSEEEIWIPIKKRI